MAKKKSVSVSGAMAAAARILGKRGGPARAEKLTAGQRKRIAQEGGEAKARKYGKSK